LWSAPAGLIPFGYDWSCGKGNFAAAKIDCEIKRVKTEQNRAFLNIEASNAKLKA
jgi:hypothetical protein